MLEDIIAHLEDSHEFIRQNFLNGYKNDVLPISTLKESDGDVRLTGGMLCDGGWLTLPQDLRLLKCPYCRDNPKMFLCQDRYYLMKHINTCHQSLDGNTTKIDKNELAYT